MNIREFNENDIGEARRLIEEFEAMIKDLLPEDLYRFEAVAAGGIDYCLLEAARIENVSAAEGTPGHVAGLIKAHNWLPEADKTAKAFLVAEEPPGHLVGFLQGHTENHKELELSRWGLIDALFIEQSSRGRGVGSELCRTVEKWFAEQGCHAVRVDTWISNIGAIKAYQAMDFKPFYTGFMKEIIPS